MEWLRGVAFKIDCSQYLAQHLDVRTSANHFVSVGVASVI
jgi:hypothetical protein